MCVVQVAAKKVKWLSKKRITQPDKEIDKALMMYTRQVVNSNVIKLRITHRFL